MNFIEIKIKRKSSTGEWVARVWENGKHKNDDNDYFATDKQDAQLTALEMAKRYILFGADVTIHL